jgi:RND family efflux transporter MFP subunit
MKLSSRSIYLVAAVLVGVGIALWLLSPREKEVAATVVSVQPAERILAVNGRIRPRLQVEVRPSMGGELIQLPFDVGDRVAEGQIIARIDDAPEVAAIAEAEAGVQSQVAVLAQARRDLSRFEALGQFTTKREIEQRRLAVTEGEKELSRRRASVVQVREMRDRRVIRAPFSGIILERPVDPGQTVGAETIIYRLADLARPEVSVEIDEIYAAEIKAGMDALVTVPGQARTIPAKVVHLEPRVDPETGARDARLALDAAVDAPSGLTVTVNLVVERRERAISLPRSTISQAGGKGLVKVVNSDGVVSERQISYVDWPSDSVIVTGGVKPGDRVLTDPKAAKTGEKVKITPAT